MQILLVVCLRENSVTNAVLYVSWYIDFKEKHIDLVLHVQSIWFSMDGHHEKAIKLFYKNFLNQSLRAASNSHPKIFLILNLIFDHYLIKI